MEVMVALTLMAVVLVPAIAALRTSIVGSEVNRDATQIRHQLTSRLERVLAESFVELEAAALAAGGPGTPSSYSDAPGDPGRLLVYLSLYDADNQDSDGDVFTGADAGIIWIRVESEGSVHSLETVTARGL